ncbi:MAG: hypothetical protein H6734_07675 [Alphaproteobacteria bacterium]|nr:hypothetical protein [Alphaproteobacteria bacterium]
MTDADAVEPAPRRSFVGRLLRWVALFVILLGIGLVSAAAAFLYPYVRDDFRIDGIVRVVALDWRDFGRARADERLRFEFADQHIGRHTSPADCALEAVGEARTVRCAWTVMLKVAGRDVPLAFDSTATIDPHGDLR